MKEIFVLLREQKNLFPRTEISSLVPTTCSNRESLNALVLDYVSLEDATSISS